MLLIVLMIEVEQPEGLSARKLVLESSRHNVITAYDGESGVRLFRRFPNVDVVVIHVDVIHPPFQQVVEDIRTVDSRVPIIALSPTGEGQWDGVNYVIPSHEPQAILKVLRSHFAASTDN